jgi:hypothetical protein
MLQLNSVLVGRWAVVFWCATHRNIKTVIYWLWRPRDQNIEMHASNLRWICICNAWPVLLCYNYILFVFVLCIVLSLCYV